MSSKNHSNDKNLEADIVVVGGGGAGMPAATIASEAGVKNIIILETRPALGGNAMMAGGMFAVETPPQKRAGVDYSRDQAFKDKMDYSNWTVDPRVVRAHINVTAEVIQWLENKGVQFQLRGTEIPGGFYPKVNHSPIPEKGERKGLGRTMVEICTKDCQKLGVKILMETTGKKLITDKKGKVTGIVATKDGKDINIKAKAVIIAAGGFSGNKKMMDKYLPTKGFRLSLSLPHKGEGILMAEEVGAIIDDCATTFFIGPHHYPYTHSLTQLLRRPEIVWVNKRGERFCDESPFLGRQHQTGHPLVRQPGEICYGLIDTNKLADMIAKKDPSGGMGGAEWFDKVYDDFKIDIKKGVAKISDSWDDIAQFIGAKPEVLKATVEQYNTYCDNGYDYDMLKDKKFLFPLRTPPFYVILGRNGFDATFGGIKINERMEVINTQYDPIPGLYAAGNNAGSAINVNYHPKHVGTSLSFAICSGYLAGKSAAKYVLGKG